MLLEVDNVRAERMSSGRLFQATGPATQNAQLPCPGYDQDATSSGTETIAVTLSSSSVRDCRSLNAVRRHLKTHSFSLPFLPPPLRPSSKRAMLDSHQMLALPKSLTLCYVLSTYTQTQNNIVCRVFRRHSVSTLSEFFLDDASVCT